MPDLNKKGCSSELHFSAARSFPLRYEASPEIGLAETRNALPRLTTGLTQTSASSTSSLARLRRLSKTLMSCLISSTYVRCCSCIIVDLRLAGRFSHKEID
jgi:hypothetical protein